MSRRRSLRSRLTLLVAAAVALAIAVCAALCWFVVRAELYRQVERSLDGPKGAQNVHWIQQYCSGAVPDRPLPPRPVPVQLVYADGTTCAVGGTPVRVTPRDLALTRAGPGAGQLREGVTEGGEEVLVMTRNAGPGLVVMESRSLDDVHSTLTTLAWVLAGVAALGVIGAASAGQLVSRAALRPVGRLTEAVEHVARTEDLGTRIPVEGTDEIARLSTSFNAMTAALAGSRERQRRLIADAGHELRTPLTSLRTNVDLLLRSENTGRPLEPEPKHRLLGNLKAQFEEMSTLVGDLLQLSRSEDEHEPHVEVGLHEVVESAVRRARLRAPDLPVEVETAPWYVHGDQAALERAVMNLLDNAIKFSGGGGGPVTVRLCDGELTVGDRGPGIPPDELPYVFDRFWRSPAARGMPGSGLGLAIVAKAVRDAGGEVALENADGGGVLARVRLPGSPRAGDVAGSAAS
ncbi:two-component system sensor histidine kinase MprB [Streptosporangium becharense]|uniref:histidine kinase n=1 Tax=Streptosporangium becharense TaxID=1816182 RepID=A0A7W9MJ33_9ACTN|nr:HAMP domain-containing sensor histidine kinase [Streptosporangium becharense]MBB2911527.1 two-component system sensor histidine kinase MprB [Streptosporangium becharense]MBB5822655.1 two-component system sensor histidine kinase MprB [Streptosporangium becharense]